MRSSTIPSAKAPAIKRRRIRWREQIPAWLFLLPALVVFAYFVWYPMLVAIGYSFQHVSLVGESTWVGLSNYQRMLADPLFVTAWQNIFNYTLLSLVFGFFVPVLLALMINEMRRATPFFQLVYYLPTLIPVTIALLVWRQIYAPEGGLLNSLLQMVSLPPQLWLQNPALAKFAIVIIMTWAGAGGTVLIYLAALQDIPMELYEAAELDGFGPWQRVRYIAIPNLASKMQVLLVLQIIAVVQVFAEPMLLTEGGPANSTLTPVLASYRIAFLQNDFGLASAWSITLLVVLSIFSIIHVWASNRNS
ncbi:sugar ABC transporter permease [Chloroflexia bacterium SDU3-3]|nr:sugar ABC transporter permease [Chloroflexia bacterium SDU3-3]